MNRCRLTPEQAIAVLVRYSQHINTKRRTIADQVILRGRLDGAE